MWDCALLFFVTKIKAKRQTISLGPMAFDEVMVVSVLIYEDSRNHCFTASNSGFNNIFQIARNLNLPDKAAARNGASGIDAGASKDTPAAFH